MKNRITSLACAFLLTVAAAAGAVDLETKVGFDIRPQPLATALIEFSKQTQLQVMSSGIDLAQRQSPGINGKHSIAHALSVLLSGTGLEYSFTGPNTIAVKIATAGSAPAGSAVSGAQTTADGMPVRLAQVPKGQEHSSSAPPETARVQDEESKGVPEILVKGQRTLNTDIKRTEDDVQPYVVFNREEIQRSMVGNLEDFFKTRLPMNAMQATNSQRQNSGNDSAVSLRGLGTAQTLILVDGRRMPSVNTGGGGLGQPDINGIPLSAIERIEVLPSTASGIYGGGATGGVVNIITRQDYSGGELAVTYGNSFDSDVANRRIDGSFGFTLENGRTQVRLNASHADANPLLVGERDFIARGRALQARNSPNDFLTGTTANTLPLGYTTNIRNASPNQNTALVLKSQYGGTNLGSPITSVAVNSSGIADGISGLVANAGHYNLGVPDDLNGQRQSMLNNPTVESAMLNVRRSFGETVDGYVDLSWLDNEGRSLMSNVAGSATLAASAPNNPFTTAINVRFPSIGLQSPYRSDSETIRALAGVIVRLPGNWTAASDFNWSRSRHTTVQTRPVIGDPDGAGPGLSVSTAHNTGVIDVMRDLNVYPIDYSAYLMPTNNSVFGPLDTVMRDATGRVSGPIFRLPGGPLNLSASVAQRKEKALTAFEDVLSATAVPSANVYPGASQTVSSYYVELRAPLITATNARRFMQSLELQASERRDEYRTRGPAATFLSLASRDSSLPSVSYSTNASDSNDYTLGLRFSPVQDVMLRASAGTGFRVPDINQIATTPLLDGSVTLNDPKRGGGRASTGLIKLDVGGNPELTPENSKSWSAGIVLAPRVLPDLRLSVDYTHISKTNEITSLGFQALVNFEDQFPGRVVRDPLEAGAPSNYTGGRITLLDVRPLNFARTRLGAYDIQADYTLQTRSVGDFRLFAVATYQKSFERIGAPGSAFLDSVGFNGGLLKWRGNAGVSWDRGPLTVGWSTQYFDSYRAYAAGSASSVIASTTLAQGSASIPRQIYHDLFMRYAFTGASPALLEGTEIALGIQNVFDKDPPIVATTATVGGYSTFADPRLRRYSINLRKRF